MQPFERDIMNFQKSQEESIYNNVNNSLQVEVNDIVKGIFTECLNKSNSTDEFLKSWSGDLKKRFPDGVWRTINGASVFINNGKVVAGLGGFNQEIDKFFENKKKDGEDKSGNRLEEIKKEIQDKSKIANALNKEYKDKYSKVDISSVMSSDEKKLNDKKNKAWSEINDLIREKQKLEKESKSPDKPEVKKEDSSGKTFSFDEIQDKYKLSHGQMYKFVSIGNWIDNEGVSTPLNIESDDYIKKLEEKGLLKIDGKKVYFTDLGKKEFNSLEDIVDGKSSKDKPEAKKEELVAKLNTKGDGIGSYQYGNDIYTFKKVQGGFDIFENGNLLDRGAKTKSDIKSVIQMHINSNNRRGEYKKENNQKDKPVNERSNQEIGEAKQKIADTMPKPIHKMTWEEFKPYGIEMQKQSAHGQPESHHKRLAKMEHDWAIKNGKSQYNVTDKQKDNSTGFNNKYLPKDKPFKIEFEQFHQGSGKHDEATVTYDKKNFTYNIEAKSGAKTKMGEKQLQEMIDNGDYKIAKEESNKNSIIDKLKSDKVGVSLINNAKERYNKDISENNVYVIAEKIVDKEPTTSPVMAIAEALQYEIMDLDKGSLGSDKENVKSVFYSIDSIFNDEKFADHRAERIIKLELNNSLHKKAEKINNQKVELRQSIKKITDKTSRNLLKIAADKLEMNFDEVNKVINVANKIKEISKDKEVLSHHIAESIQYLDINKVKESMKSMNEKNRELQSQRLKQLDIKL